MSPGLASLFKPIDVHYLCVELSLDIAGNFHERLFNIDVCFGTCLHKADIVLLSKLWTFVVRKVNGR